jgi:hypothetical protein
MGMNATPVASGESPRSWWKYRLSRKTSPWKPIVTLEHCHVAGRLQPRQLRVRHLLGQEVRRPRRSEKHELSDARSVHRPTDRPGPATPRRRSPSPPRARPERAPRDWPRLARGPGW